MILNNDWFEKNQKILLWLLNSPFTRKWFRWVLRIRNTDAGYTKKILHLYPHAYSVLVDKEHIGFDFRTHNKFAKRLYYEFYYFWLLLHTLDSFFKLFAVPLSFGFDSFVLFPQAGNGGSNVSCDGTARYQSSELAYASIVAAAGTSAQTGNVNDDFCSLGTGPTTNLFNLLIRSIFTFDTSVLKAGATSATFSLVVTSNTTNYGGTSFNVVSAFPASNNTIVSSDYSNLGSTAFATLAQNTLDATGTKYTDFVLSRGGIANINQDAVSGFGVRDTWDIGANFTGAWAGNTFNGVKCFFADNTGANQDPKLFVVTQLMFASIPGVVITRNVTVTGY